MSNPTTENFYQLIRRNRGSVGRQTTSLIVNGNEIYSPDDQRNVFAKNYEKLSVLKITDTTQPSWHSAMFGMN